MKKFLNKSEIKFLILVSALLIIISTLPFVYGYLIRGDNSYLGLVRLSPVDTSVYYSYIGQVKEGNFLLDDLFTQEGSQAQLFNPFWLVVGLSARLFNLSPLIAYQLWRILLLPLFLLVLYKFCAYFFNDKNERIKKYAFLFLLLAGGWGGFVRMLSPEFYSQKIHFTLDLLVAEASNFLILFYSPHFLASLILLITTYYLWLLAMEKQSLKLAVYCGLSALGLFSFHPFFVLPVYLIPGVFLLFYFGSQRKIIWPAVWSYLLLIAISLPGVLYYGLSLMLNVWLKIKASQNNCFTPNFVIVILSLGFLFFLANFTAYYLLSKRKLDFKTTFLLVWFYLNLLLIYAPVNWQRRLSEGLQIPTAILAFMAVLIILGRLKNKFSRALLYFLILLLGYSNLVFYFENLAYLGARPDIAYVSRPFTAALAWYHDQTDARQLLLASNLSGNVIPGQIYRRVYLGHSVETLNYVEKYYQAASFFSGNTNDQAKINFLRDNRIDYVFYSVNEKSLGSFEPQAKNYLQEVYRNSEVKIYKVILK